MPITELKFKVYPTKKPWSKSLESGREDINENDKRVVDLVHYPRQLGGDRTQILFYTSRAASPE